MDGHPGGIHRGLNLLEPFIARPDVAVRPGLEEALVLEDAEMGDKTVLPGLVFVAVGDEDAGDRHFLNCSGLWDGRVFPELEGKRYSSSVATKATSPTRRTTDQLWFHHPEMQTQVARAEEDFASGRATRTETPEQAQAFLDSLKKTRR
jgi:hypothetical protein